MIAIAHDCPSCVCRLCPSCHEPMAKDRKQKKCAACIQAAYDAVDRCPYCGYAKGKTACHRSELRDCRGRDLIPELAANKVFCRPELVDPTRQAR
jgi:hypothetical protein